MNFCFRHIGKNILITGLLSLSAPLWAHASAVQEEILQRDLQSFIAMKQSGVMVPLVKPKNVAPSEWLNAIELAQDESRLTLSLESFVAPSESANWPLGSRIRSLRMKLMAENAVRGQVEAALKAHQLDSGAIYELLNLEAAMGIAAPAAWSTIFADCRRVYPVETAIYDHLTKVRAQTAPQDILDLYSTKPAINLFQNGAYDHKPRLFMFCRQDRNFPCLRVMKDQADQPVRNADGTLWSLPSLALSKYGKPFNLADGNTPEGIHLADGVIQDGSDPMGFGKFSRIVLNFVAKSDGEASMKLLLPASSQGLDWWNEAVVARDIGRSNLRMHGTGVINLDPKTPYFPLVPTSGCIASRENKYGDTSFVDQQELLAMWQKSMGLVPSHDNENKISGIVYVIEIDNQAAPVTLADLAAYGIK